ncbi:phosphate/phosphite/phosphonate ABC transporter substrate-binding protein [Thermodesulfobacteriota bacterium]
MLSNIEKIQHLTKLIGFAILVFLYGCGGDADGVTIDFSKTVQVPKAELRVPGEGQLRVAVGAMISPKETFIYYQQLLDYISRMVGLKGQLIQRKTYGEINEIFGKGQIDLAFVCSGPYATGKERYGFELLATPQIQGSPFYRSYLIVNKDSTFHEFKDLRNRIFAFTDPESNTGRLVPTYWLRQLGETPESFFSKTIYTYSHDNSILAVARSLVDGACVDGLIWEYYSDRDPSLTSRTRVIKKSEDYGIPPLVVSKTLSPTLKLRIRQLVLSMHLNSEGRDILKALMIDRFIEPREEWYAGIRRMVGGIKPNEEPYALSQH